MVMRTKLLYFAAVAAAVLLTASCSKEKENGPVSKNYYQIDGGIKIPIKWAATDNLEPEADAGYTIALCPVVPADDIDKEPTAFIFEIPLENMGHRIELTAGGVEDPATWEWYVDIIVKGEYYSTGEDYRINEVSITGGWLQVTRRGTDNWFTIGFRFELKDGKIVTGSYTGALTLSDNVYL